MKLKSRTLTRLALAGALCLPALASAQSGPVVFDGITHYAAGDSTLQLTPNGSHLIVSNLGSQGNDGVISVLDSAISWDAQLTATGSEIGDVMKFGAFSDGVRTAGARVQMVSNGFLFNAAFTGAEGQNLYTLQVLADGQLVAEFPGQTSTSNQTVGPIESPWPPFDPFPWPIPIPLPEPWPWPDFRIGTLGNCIWGFQFGSNVTVSSDGGGTAVGNEIRMVEAPPAGGHSLYLEFNGIKIQTNVDGLALQEENEISNGI